MIAGSGTEPEWVADVLEFWFDELGSTGWFAKSEPVDAAIRNRFGGLHARLAAEDGIDHTTPRAVLAAVIVLDQFARNMYRGTPNAFATDPLARRLARDAVHRGLDAALTREERLFLYMPFEHSEDRDDQALAVRLIERLQDPEWTRYALAHQAIVERFGRFPHRNAILGRTTTAEELALLDDPMGAF